MNASIRFQNDARLTWSVAAAMVIMGAVNLTAAAQDGMLQTIREDVRGGAPVPAASPSADRPADNRNEDCYDASDWTNCQNGTGCQSDSNCQSGTNSPSDGSAVLGCLIGVGAVVATPIWVPHALLGDDFRDPTGYHASPYDGAPCYDLSNDRAAAARPLAARLDVDYLNTFNRVDSIGGHLLVETASRFGLDASVDHFEERLRSGGRDRLELGDCNLVYRFAQSDRAEFRAGLGLNWMSDSCGGDVGFNFTYGVDLYPRKPWVLSSTIDCGTLGQAGLFRFRTTAGVVFHGVETFAGYEYTDIGRTHWNALIAGLRFWF
jgi:hypothetical protein